jgi:hypothetical protein
MRMTYSSFDANRGRFCIGMATSPDGFRWTKKGVIFDGSADADAHDALGACSAHVVGTPPSNPRSGARGWHLVCLPMSHTAVVQRRAAPLQYAIHSSARLLTQGPLLPAHFACAASTSVRHVLKSMFGGGGGGGVT